jgi:hypothetical protein
MEPLRPKNSFSQFFNMACVAVSSQEAMVTLNEEFELLRFLHKFDRRFKGVLWERIMDRIDSKRDQTHESKFQCLMCCFI